MDCATELVHLNTPLTPEEVQHIEHLDGIVLVNETCGLVHEYDDNSPPERYALCWVRLPNFEDPPAPAPFVVEGVEHHDAA